MDISRSEEPAPASSYLKPLGILYSQKKKGKLTGNEGKIHREMGLGGGFEEGSEAKNMDWDEGNEVAQVVSPFT